MRDVPITIGRPSVGELAEAAEKLEVVLDGLAEADPRIEHHPLLLDPLADRERETLCEERLDLGDNVLVARFRCIVRGSPSMCMRQHSPPLSAMRPAMSPSPRSAVTSFMRLAPAATASRATAALEVSIEIWAPRVREAFDHRHHPRDLLLGADRLRARAG